MQSVSDKLLKKVENYLQEGKQLEEQEKLAQAIEQYSKALQLDPDCLLAHHQLAEIYESLKELEKAIHHYQRVIQKEPDNIQALAKLAGVMKDQGDFPKAITTYQKVLDQNSKKPKWFYAYIFVRLANALRENGQIEKAINIYEKAIKLKPKELASIYCQLGDTLFEKIQERLRQSLAVKFTDWQKILDSYHKAIELKPESPVYYDKLGQVLVSQGRLEQAIDIFKKAITIEPSYIWSYPNIGEALGRQGKLDQVKYYCREGLKIYWGSNQIKKEFSQKAAQQPISIVSSTGTKKKLAFCFLTIRGLNHDLVWQNFFKGYEDAVNIYAHSKFEENLGFIQKKQIPKQIATTYHRYKMGAEIELLKEALKCTDNYKFIILSESCLPLQLFSYVYEKLLADEKSFVKMIPTISSYWRYWSAVHNKVTGLTKQECRKNSQWIILNRKHAQMIVDSNLLYESVKRVPFLEEQYPSTLLNLKGQVDDIHNKQTTFSDFKRQLGPRPHTFSEITEFDRMLLLAAKNKGLLFARKFPETVNLKPLYRETELAELLVHQ